LTEMEGGLDGAEGLSLPRVVIEELRERARRAGSTVEEYVLDLLTRDEDPREAWRRYLGGAVELLERAEAELKGGELRQASEKIWGPVLWRSRPTPWRRRGLDSSRMRTSGPTRTRWRRSSGAG